MNNVVVIEINNASSSLYSAVDKAENCEPNEYQSEFDQNNNEYAVDYAHNEIATAGDNEEDDYISSTPQNQGIPPNATIEVTPTTLSLFNNLNNNQETQSRTLKKLIDYFYTGICLFIFVLFKFI